MSTYFDVLDTNEGPVHILTKSRWLAIFPMPRTAVMPHSAGNLKRLGTSVKWTTDDPAVLETLHRAIVHLVQEVGISGLVEIANSVKVTEQVAKTFGGHWRDIVGQAAEDGVPFPIPETVLRYVKRFL
jgi:hypothetical protein